MEVLDRTWLRLWQGPKLKYRGHVAHLDAGHGRTECGLAIANRGVPDRGNAPKCRICEASVS